MSKEFKYFLVFTATICFTILLVFLNKGLEKKCGEHSINYSDSFAECNRDIFCSAGDIRRCPKGSACTTDLKVTCNPFYR